MRLSRRIMSSSGSFNSSSYSFTGTDTYTDEGNGAWNIQFKTSGTLTVYTTAIIDVHCVGGGGGGAVEGWGAYAGGGGGGGGFTNTSMNKTLSPGTYTITIGGGGSAGYWDDTNYQDNERLRPAGKGGTSSAFSVSALGGNGGTRPAYNTYGQSGGNGGSGGGAGSVHPGDKQTDGASNGGTAADSVYDQGAKFLGGTGQGTTTRDFGDPDGTLRCGGGGGGGYNNNSTKRAAGGAGGGGTGGNGWDRDRGTAGTANYGGGGGGEGTGHLTANTGGAGIIIIRSHR